MTTPLKSNGNTLEVQPSEHLVSLAAKQAIRLEAITSPHAAQQKLHDALMPFSTPYGSTSNRTKVNMVQSQSMLWLISNGSVSFYRVYDDLKIAVAAGPIVMGLAELFEPLGRYYFKTARGAKIASISIERAKEVFSEHGLWQEVAEVLAFTVHMMGYRDEHLVSKNSYSIIRAKLFEYMNKKDVADFSGTGIVAYIQETTHLSRSLIYKIISYLIDGNYIKVRNGKLMEIVKLPKNF